VELAQRTETIQFLREALYRLCEQSLDGTMSEAAVEQEYDNALKTALALAQADLAKAQSGVPAPMANPKVQELWNKLLSQTPQGAASPATAPLSKK
jgi:hypothetical protein